MATLRPAVRLRSRFIALVDRLEARQLLTTLPTGFVESAVNAGTLSSATAMQFAPDGKLYVLEQNGTIEVFQGSGSTAWTQVAPNSNFLSRASNGANHITTTPSGERGLLGIAFHPNFATNRFVYVYYTVPGTPAFNRISRFTANAAGTQVVENSETVLVNLDNLTSATNHNGGAMHFGPDGKLYVAVGENATASNAQSLANRHGKMLRYNDDGTIPSDNPTSIAGITGTTSGANRAIWAAGLRNPYTFAFHPTSGLLYINDVGQNTWEEVNVGAAGANYGWSATEGRFNQASFPNFTNPILAYPHTTASTPFPTNNGGNYAGFAITGGTFYVSNNPVFPSDYIGDFFYADYVSNFIRRMDVTGTSTQAFATNAGAPVDLKTGPDGRLFYLSRTDGKVYRVDFTGSAMPYIVNQPENRTASSGAQVTFTATAGGPGTLQYQWQRNDVDVPGATSASFTFTATEALNNSTYRVRVTNTTGSVTSNPATLTVIANQAPTPTILTPVVGTKFSYGTTVSFSGSATDPEDGSITNPARYSWRVSYFTNVVERPFVPDSAGITSGSFDIPSSSPYTLPDVYYRIYLTVTDSNGTSATTFRDITPNTAQVTLTTNPAGGNVLLDGSSLASPHVFTGVTGQTRSIEAPTSFVLSGQTYNFQSWSDGGARVHDIATPASNTTYTANYVDVTAPAVTGTQFQFETQHRVVVNFTESVAASLTTGDITVENLTTGQPVPASGNWTITNGATTTSVNFNPLLPDGRYRVTLDAAGITDAAGNPLSSNAVVSFHILAGDANRDQQVNFDDLLILAANYNFGSRTFSQGDFDYNGTVNFDDLLILAAKYNTGLSSAPAAARSAPPPAPTFDQGDEESPKEDPIF